jgi:hypothetical protein
MSTTIWNARAQSRARELQGPFAPMKGVTKRQARDAARTLALSLGAEGYRIVASHRRGKCTLKLSGKGNIVVIEADSWEAAWNSMRTKIHQFAAGQLVVKGGRLVAAR